MYAPTQKLVAPAQYGFPYEPYDIQSQLMENLYGILENKEIGIFESPTGTGKSLTLTCSALRWLEDHERLVREEIKQRITSKEKEIRDLENKSLDALDWISAQYKTNQERAELNDLRRLSSLVTDYDRELDEMRKRQTERKSLMKRKEKFGKISGNTANIDNNDDRNEAAIEKDLEDEVLLTETPGGIEDDVPKQFKPVQIFFCSRTHSQLAQVVREVKRTEYGQRIRCVTLGSRQQLCVNPQVKRLNNGALINDRCLEMAEKHKNSRLIKSIETENIENIKSSCGCPFKTAKGVQSLKESALVDILDMEDLITQGTEQRACPYYAARSAATTAAHLVMLPYQMLLHQRTRMLSGIDLRGAVVIIDEAHNLLDTIVQMHSCEINLEQLIEIKDAIIAYKSRFVKLFSAPNLLCINQLLFVVRRLIKMLEPKVPVGGTISQQKVSSRTLRTYELAAEGEFFNIDLYELLKFCERTRFAQKLTSYAKSRIQNSQLNQNCLPESKENSTLKFLQQLQQDNINNRKKCKKKANEDCVVSKTSAEIAEVSPITTVSSLPIFSLIAFLESFTENADDGRVIVHIDGTYEGSHYRYTVLNPSRYFDDVVNEARAIIIAGGTMQPTNELTEQIFQKNASRVRLHFYDHVVSEEAVLPLVVQNGPTGRRLCFNYSQRSSTEMITELGMILQNLCQVVPAGVVCFLPSYDFLDKVYDHLSNSNILKNIDMKKCVFRESRKSSKNGQSVEQLLRDYAESISKKGGALLLSVVGGKLNEGLNFKDDLCRAVIVVGMPYANSQSTELQERMSYMDTTLGSGAGNQYYENLCMKAVNQCIGRAVRHINDYAAVYLLDARYSQDHIRKKLPQWISRGLQIPTSFGSVQATTAKFFKQKKCN